MMEEHPSSSIAPPSSSIAPPSSSIILHHPPSSSIILHCSSIILHQVLVGPLLCEGGGHVDGDVGDPAVFRGVSGQGSVPQTVQYSYSAVEYSTVQYRTVQYSTALYRLQIVTWRTLYI